MVVTTDQRWQAQEYVRSFGFVAQLGTPVLDLLGAKRGERILDLGCGDGTLTERIADTGASVVGVDASPDMIEAALGRGLDAHLVAGEDLAMESQFDAVFTNAALHWMRQPERVAANVFRALKRGGRFAGEFGGFGNCAAVRATLHEALARRNIDPLARDPWYFPSDDDYRHVLEEAGFRVEQIHLFPRQTRLSGALGDWIDMFAQSFLAGQSEDVRAAIKAEIETTLAPILRDSQGRWFVDYVRLRFLAQRPI
jgi:trans-aconitate methyltransferase